jgi:branched-chain amino acid transport system ATP-binding protein
MEEFLCTEDLSRNFGGVKATDCVCMTIENKGLRSIIGPNGAGKTTFINLVTGRIPASSGKVSFLGKDMTNKPAHELVKIGVCRTFQINSIFEDLTVFENVRIAKQAHLGGSMRFFSRKNDLKNVNEETWSILQRMDLEELAKLPAKNLAYGDQRVLEVAIALASSPRILFLDEPTAGMSPAETKHISDLICGLAEEISIVLVEHDMDLVMSISDRISVLHYGGIIAEGTPDEIKRHDLVREAYLGKEA